MKQTINFFTLLLISSSFFFTSCGGDDGPTDPVVYAITLSTADATTTILGQNVTFHLVDNNNRDLTNDTNVTYKVDGTAMTSNVFSSNTVGSYEITATYNDIVSNVITVKILTVAYTQKPLVEDYTGAWCGWCPRIAHSIELVEAETDNAIPVAIHNGDSMTYEFESQLRSYFGVDVFPTAKVNRIDWRYPEYDNTAQVTALAENGSDVGLAISSTRTGNGLSINVSAKFSLTHTEPLKLVVCLLEDGLHETQTNYTSFYGGNSTIPNMEHNHVLRKIYTNLLGDAIPSTDTGMGDTYTRNFSVTIPAVSQGTASDKLQLVAYIVDARLVINGPKLVVLNAQKAYVDTTQNFD